MFKNLLIFSFLVFFFTTCFSHKYVVTKSNQPRSEEDFHIRMFTLLGSIPIYRDLDQSTVCPGKKIRMINMHDSAFNGLICGATFFIVCPHTVGIECVEK